MFESAVVTRSGQVESATGLVHHPDYAVSDLPALGRNNGWGSPVRGASMHDMTNSGFGTYGQDTSLAGPPSAAAAWSW